MILQNKFLSAYILNRLRRLIYSQFWRLLKTTVRLYLLQDIEGMIF